MNERNRVLIVDDTEMNRAMLADMLCADYDVIEAENGKEAVDILNRENSKISIVLLDIVMPEMDGFEVLAQMNKNGWIDHIPVITISAETSSTIIDHAYDLGASDYISRPFDERIVKRRVHNTMMLYSKQKMLENMVVEQIAEKEKNSFLMVEILSNIVEFRNGESGLHVLHIRVLTEIFLRKLLEITDKYPMSAAHMALIVNASALHDIGKISIPEEILNKPGKLTPEEFEVMKTHSALGAKIMEDAKQRHHEELVKLACNICRWHHERYDGKGYPDGLVGEEIPIEAQVVALADIYDALTSVRVYKYAYSHEEAQQMILNGECGAFNPLLMQCLKEVRPNLKEELQVRSFQEASVANIGELSSQMIANGQISGRTLTLLEQERVKYQFFASMSNEIQFEYSYKNNIVNISESGAQQLGLPALIKLPEDNEIVNEVLSKEDFHKLKKRLRGATQENPIVENIYKLCINGEKRWCKITVRPLWDYDEPGAEITRVIGKLVDIHDEQLRLNTLKRKAEHDSLTGLNNHASVKKEIQAALKQPDKRFAVALFDLDNFKSANDRFGHLFGDGVLKYVADSLKASVCAGGISARVGGDEFLVFLEYKTDVESDIKRIFDSIRGKYKKFEVSVSMGVALVPENGTDYDSLFHEADQALYQAKNDGKGRYMFYEENMKESLSVLSPMDH